MGAVVPIFGLDPRPYHWIPVVFHLLNTVLFYRFARRFLADSLSVLAAVGFWGLHSVVAWITYDAACISDLLLATFFLSSLLLAVDGLQRDSWLRMCGSLILFLCALFTKEAALTFPLALLLALCLGDLQKSAHRPSWADILQSVKRALPLTSIALVL